MEIENTSTSESRIQPTERGPIGFCHGRATLPACASGILWSRPNDPDRALALHKSNHMLCGPRRKMDHVTLVRQTRGIYYFPDSLPCCKMYPIHSFSNYPLCFAGMITPPDSKKARWRPQRGVFKPEPILTSLLLGLASARLSRAKATITLLFSPAQCTTI